MNADDIIAAARECLGTPFHHQGRVVGRGLDCGGVIVHVATRVGAEHIDLKGYGHSPPDITGTLDAWPSLCAAQEMQAGDLLLLRFDAPRHLAIFTGTTIIHCYAAARRVAEHDFDAEWRNRLVKIYRFKGVA